MIRTPSRLALAMFACALLAFGLACAPAVHAAPAAPVTWAAYQRNFYFQQIDSRNGLVQNSVSLIFQDDRGFMWLATQGGLFRYDGYTLTRYVHDPDRADSLPNDALTSALADAGNGRLWVGSRTDGLTLFDPAANRTLPLPASIARVEPSVSSLLNLPDGRVLVGSVRGVDILSTGAQRPSIRTLWAEPLDAAAPVRAMAACRNGMVYAIARNTVVALDPAQGKSSVLATLDHPANAIACSPGGDVLIGDAYGLARIDRHSGAVTRLWQTADHAGVTAVAIDHAQRLWLALTNHSLVRIAADGTSVTVAPAPLGIHGGLPDAAIQVLLVDDTGLLWVGTRGAGAVWTRPERGPIEAALNLNGDLRKRAFVRGFAEAPDGNFWVTTSDTGLVLYDPATHTVTSYKPMLDAAIAALHPDAAASVPLLQDRRDNAATWFEPTGPTDVRVFRPIVDGKGHLLLPTNQGVLDFDPASGRAAFWLADGKPDTTPTRVLLRARDGDVWAAPFGGGGLVRYHDGHVVQRFNTADGLAGSNVMALVQAPDGAIWAGTTDGLSRIDPAGGSVRNFRETPGDNASLAGRIIISLLIDRHGALWAGSLSGISRLQRLDASGARFKRYTLADGLPDNTVDCMLQDARGNIWFSTNLGVGRLNPASGKLRSFGIADGTQGDEYNAGACLRTRAGKLLFGGNGFDIIDPARLRLPTGTAPVSFTAFSTGHGNLVLPVQPHAVLTLEPDERSIHAAFATLDYAESARNVYRTRLTGPGHRGGWSLPTTEHSIAFTNLAPGSYTLGVEAVLPDGAAGKSAALQFHIPTAWWWTLPMRIAYAAALLLLVLAAAFGWLGHHREQARYRRQLALRESRLRQALWGSGDEFWDWDLAHGTILRLGPEDAPGGHYEESIAADQWRTTMVHPDDLAGLDQALAEHLAGKTEHFEVEHRVRGRDGDWTWVVSRGRIVERAADGTPLRVCGTERDVSARRAADRDRRIASEVIRNMSEAVAVTDLDFRFISVNTAFTRMTGYAEHEVLGRDAALLNGSRHAPENYVRLRETLAEIGHWRGELWQRRKDGEEFLCWVELNEVCDAGGHRTHMICVLTDITDRKRAEQELRYLANYDTLTGLPNRALLGERLGAALINARRSSQKVGLLFLDLDRFKHVNDSLGHTAGDLTLKAAGERLRQCVRETDVVARLGGDEFTVVLEDLIDARGAEEMAQRLIKAFSRPLLISGTQEATISPSIGIALYPDHGQTPADLLKCADTAMYYAKERGRNTWAVYHAGMDVRARDHATLATALRHALERNELRLVYQPKLALGEDGGITGMEALLRWHSRELGEIPPTVFIPLAEETGQINDISTFVFGTACDALRRFREAGHRDLTMAINLSVAQLNRPDLTLHICNLLAAHDVAPNQVELELTESMVMANAEQSVRLLGELKSIGARLAIDDFGTGYSSLAYLKRLPIDTLKIDQTFVGDITTDPDDAAITSTIITLAHSLGLKVVAEGVETVEQLAFLRGQRCDEIQGFWLSEPLSADACLAFLDRRTATRTDPA